jgi:hypothetical protein
MAAVSCASVMSLGGVGGLCLVLAIAVAVKMLGKKVAKK